MLDDENDTSIKEAAQHYHPAYDDTAWEKMSQLLDEHLPQKKERKKIFFVLPFLLVVAVIVFFILLNNGKKDSSNISQNISPKNNTEKLSPEKEGFNPAQKDSPSSTRPTKNSSSTKNNKTKNYYRSTQLIPLKENKISFNLIHQNKNETLFYNNKLAGKENQLNQQPVSETSNNNEKNKASTPVDLKSATLNNNSSIPVATTKNNFYTKKLPDEDKVAKNQKDKASSAIKKSEKTNSGFANNFGISVSAGPDISGVHENKIGRLTAIFGAALDYSLSKNFRIRSGFYISKKIYSVDGDDYDLPGGNSNYAYLENVKANCTVYEIPVKADYNFKRIKNHQWFVSTGLSSYLMKKENYDYYYKTVSGETYYKDWTINNKNKYFFSVLTFSGGYEYFLNKQFAFAAEPYINLPSKGVGEGKVKLNSGGILLTLKMKPFLKKEK